MLDGIKRICKYQYILENQEQRVLFYLVHYRKHTDNIKTNKISKGILTIVSVPLQHFSKHVGITNNVGIKLPCH